MSINTQFHQENGEITMVDKLIKGIVDNTLLTENETIEVISILIRKGINLIGMEINQAINYVVDKTKIHGCRMYAWLECKKYYNNKEFDMMAHDLRSGRCLIYYTNEVEK